MVIYFTECTLATIDMMALKTPIPKGEFNRQIGIAQKGIDVLRHYDLSLRDYGRIEDVLFTFERSVKKWANSKIEF